MIRRLRLGWPAPLATPAGRSTGRLLAVSDERLAALGDERNREAIRPVDAVLGCGDVEPDYLASLGDAFRAPLFYVRGNHDRGVAWEEGQAIVPQALNGRVEAVLGIPIAGMSWPSRTSGRAERSETSAWLQAARLYLNAGLARPAPRIILSHVPPREAGDTPSDPYHTGFAAYRWLCRRLRPVLWLHGHTTVAATEHWRTTLDETTLLNVTGAVLVELEPSAG